MPVKQPPNYNGFKIRKHPKGYSIRCFVPEYRHATIIEDYAEIPAYIDRWWKRNPPASIVVLHPSIPKFLRIVFPCCGTATDISIRQLRRWNNHEVRRCFFCSRSNPNRVEPPPLPPVYPPLWDVPPIVLEWQKQYGRNFNWTSYYE